MNKEYQTIFSLDLLILRNYVNFLQNAIFSGKIYVHICTRNPKRLK